MKKKVKGIIIFVVILVLAGSLVAYLLFGKNLFVNSYGCNEIMEQVDICWENRNPASTESFIECWRAPTGYTNLCEELEQRDYLDTYWKCDRLRIIYFPPHMLSGFPDKPEGIVSPECPTT